MKAVRAFLDYRIFGALPYAGGAFDQPAALLEEMRIVSGIVADEERKKDEAASKKAARKKPAARSPTRRR